MRLKKETKEYYVYDCPLCGKETRILPDEDEGGQCWECRMNLASLKYYEEQAYLVGAVITEIHVSTDSIEHIHIRKGDGVEECISSEDNRLWVGDCLYT